MNSKLLFKAAFVRGELDDFERQSCIKKDVRIDFILENVFSYLLPNVYNFDALCSTNEKEKHLIEKIKKILNAFRDSYSDPVKILCAELTVINEENISSILLDVADELFSEGITWSKIIAFFAFVGELTTMCIKRKLPKSLVNVMYESFSRLVKVKLESWIDDHDGWEGLTSLSIVTQPEHLLRISKPSWAKSVLNATNRLISQFKR